MHEIVWLKGLVSRSAVSSIEDVYSMMCYVQYSCEL